jgi:hypothetical protein
MRDAPDRAALARLADRAAAAGRAPEAVALARAVIARETAAGAVPVDAWAARLAALYDVSSTPADLERRLAADLRAGACDRAPRRAAVQAHLIATVRAKLAELDPALIATWPLLDGVLDGALDGDAP